MTAHTHRLTKGVRVGGQREKLEYRLLVALSYAPCLIYTALTRASGRTTQTPDQSVFAEALSSARAAVGYAYMA